MAGGARFYGIYRATVLNDSDPMQLGRKQVLVPSVSGQGSGWAMPCVSGGTAAEIAVGDSVWVMFEGGDPTAPVCMGSMAS